MYCWFGPLDSGAKSVGVEVCSMPSSGSLLFAWYVNEPMRIGVAITEADSTKAPGPIKISWEANFTIATWASVSCDTCETGSGGAVMINSPVLRRAPKV